MSQQWIWMSLAAVMVAQVDPNPAGAINSGQTNPGAPAGSMTGAPPGSTTGLPSTQPYSDTGGGADAGTGGSGTGAVLPQPYSATPSLTNPVAGTQGDIAGSGAVLPSDTGGMASPISGNSVSGTGAVLPSDTGGLGSPGAGNTVSGTGAVLPPAAPATTTGPAAAGAAGTTLSPDTNTSSNSVTPLGGGSIVDEAADDRR
ncbi:hypothetical protein [Corallococcus llansteffanensis]|nr:hypothetical protein [Corallococcus llansteffanensis]